MLTFKLFQDGFYLTEGDQANPADAQLAFLFQNAETEPDTYELSQESYVDPNRLGYFAFFAPSATRDWSAFASQVRTLFEATAGAQFGWFTGEETVVAQPLIQVINQSSVPAVQLPFSYIFENVRLTLNASAFSTSKVSYDDETNRFQFQNTTPNTLQLIVNPPGGAQSTFFSSSANLLLPMDDPNDPDAGSVNADFSLNVNDLSQFEAGFMFFSAGAAQTLHALSYPLVRAADDDATPMNFSAWLDVNRQLDSTRSYFQMTDNLLGSYYADNVGNTFTLSTVNGSDIAKTSRFAFSNRPVDQNTLTGNYYLTPAGSFGLGLNSGTEKATANLLCGVTGTEFLTVALPETGTEPTAAAVDTLDIQPGQDAFQQQGGTTADPSYLSNLEGKATTSWVRFETQQGDYVSQPQESPLYDQPTQETNTMSASGLDVKLLDFLPLPTWKSADDSPLVPMVPYSGIPTLADLTPFYNMESNALNPTRRQGYVKAQTAATPAVTELVADDDQLTYAMMPQGLLAGLNSQNVWEATQIAISASIASPGTDDILQFTQMGTRIRTALQQNQIYLVMSTLEFSGQPLFDFSGSNQTVNIAGWPFELSPEGTRAPDAQKTPPIVILKLFPGRSIKDLTDDLGLWSQADVFNDPNDYSAADAQAFIQAQIQAACEAVYGAGNCPDGVPGGTADTHSLYYNFYQVVTDPNFTGLLTLNANMRLENLPSAIRAVTGGMTKNVNGEKVSNIDAFRVHHVGVSINDTQPAAATPTLSQSSLFGLVDYEKPADSGGEAGSGVDVFYNYEVEFLRALFINSELRTFSCKINLTINNLFDTNVALSDGSGGNTLVAGGDNIIVITGSYQAHSTTGDDSNSGEGLYSFIAEGNFVFNYDENPYLQNITLTKLQFSFDQETPADSSGEGTTTHIQASFAIWGNMVFKELKILDIFSFQKLTFADLGIGVAFDLTIPPSPATPTTSTPTLSFAPGNLRLDLAESPPKKTPFSLLNLLPFKLQSFLYSQHADQTLDSLKFFPLSSIPGQSGLVDTFNYALIFTFDLGSQGGLAGALSAFKFSFIVGWRAGEAGGIAFGVSLPEFDGKLEIKIQGVLSLVIQEFKLQYQVQEESDDLLILVLHNSYMEVFGTRLPPGNAMFDFALFVPTSGNQDVGWIAAINNTAAPSTVEGCAGHTLVQAEDENSVFELKYLGGGQRVGPDPENPPTNFKSFLEYMTGGFWEAIKNNEYDKVYHPNSNWLILTDFKLLKIIEVGFIFYDVTPFYSLTLNVENLFNFEITYTKISDSIGLFYANFSLPDSLRTYNVGFASVTLPAVGVSVYTNGDWKVDLGFPENDDWSRSFKVNAQAGPVPLTGSGGFYLARLSSATSSVFEGQYPMIIAFGVAIRIGVGKDFTAGPLKAGISVTFFGIVEGAAGYLSSGSENIFSAPDALSLKGQLGVIGELYGSVDFVIVQASVNVTLQASIGAEVLYERTIPGSGSLVLYIDASVMVSLKVKINLGLFSITMSFSYMASFRFEWQAIGDGGSSATQTFLLASAARTAPTFLATPVCDGLNGDLTWWFLPEPTTVFPATTGTGTPYFVGSLAVEYDPAPPVEPTFPDLKPFETMTAQLSIWAVGQALEKSGCNYEVTQTQMDGLNQCPTLLVDWITYDLLIEELAGFAVTVVIPQGEAGTEKSASMLPMLPFLKLATNGRLDSAGEPEDFNYQFLSKNVVDDNYIQQVDAWFSQLFVNQTSERSPDVFLNAAGGTPLVQETFLNFYKGLIRGSVNVLLQTMQNDNLETAKIQDLILKTIGGGGYADLGGQMSSSFRGGTRLPYTQGLTVPDGAASTSDNPMYALLWQEFPVGGFAEGDGYTLNLANPDADQSWVTCAVAYDVTKDWADPYGSVDASAIQPTSTPVQLPFNNIGPQSFAYQNPVVWNQPDEQVAQLRPFPNNQKQLLAALGTSFAVLVESRASGAAYLPGGNPLPPSDFAWATQINLSVAQVPLSTGGSFMKDVFALSGSSVADQQLLEQILRALADDDVVESLQILFQEESGESGLTSKTINADDVFVLRTNTTTVSAPPAAAGLAFVALTESPDTTVGATIGETEGFLNIIQQVSITNASGYYLRYIDSEGNSLPEGLFSGAPAALTLLITFKGDSSANTEVSPSIVQPYYNTLVLHDTQADLVYYSVTTDPALDTQYSVVAAGAVGVELLRHDEVTLLRASVPAAATCGFEGGRRLDRVDLIRQLMAAGTTSPAELTAMLADSGEATAQLNALYALITYQVEASAGFILSNLSAGIQPQAEEDDDSGERRYRIFVPLYNLATSNQGGTGTPNRYASIGDDFTIDFFQNDAFGNVFPNQQTFSSTNYYFDPIVPLAQWNGIVSAFGYNPGEVPAANSFRVFLSASEATFSELSPEEVDAYLQSWITIQDQIQGPCITLSVETNLARTSNGNRVDIPLSADQTAAVVALVDGVVSYLENYASDPPFDIQPVDLELVAQGAGALPAVFEMAVAFTIQRDPNLISPELKDSQGNVTYPPAQIAQSPVAPTVGSSLADGSGSVSIDGFAAQFVQAFPDTVVAVSLNDGRDQNDRSTAGAASKRLQASGIAGDGSGGGDSTPQSIWATQRSLLEITVGVQAGCGPFYLSPKPLDNTLNTGEVPMPELPESIRPENWSLNQLFTDVDLDVFNSSFFDAVDNMLEPGSAAKAFEMVRGAYATIAEGRGSLADEYSRFEIEWLFSSQSPFTGTGEQIDDARETFGQEMRAALATAYAVDTLVQYGVNWGTPLPADVGDTLELFGSIQSADSSQLPEGVTFSAVHVPISPTRTSLMTILFGVADIAEIAQVTLDLAYNVTHLQYFLEPANQVPPGEARPSVWLQLINPYQSLPHLGPADSKTEIPLVFRQYPTPPTLIGQSGTGGAADGSVPSGENPLTAAAAWYLQTQYQAQFTVHDELLNQITYNTDLSSASASNTADPNALIAATGPFTLFEALARFNGTYAVIQPILTQLDDPNWATAADVFAGLVSEVVANTNWNPVTANALRAATLESITDHYTVTDESTGTGDARLITMTWDPAQGESSFQDAVLSILALGPTGMPYPNQVPGTTENGITDSYTPVPPLVDNTAAHGLTLDGLNVLSAENALTGVQIERNVIEMSSGGVVWTSLNPFIYKTPLVRPTQPVTPIVDNELPVDIAQLPNQGISKGCPEESPTPGVPCLCQRIYTMLFDLLADPDQTGSLARAQINNGVVTGQERRLKLSCGLRYPVITASGGTPGTNPVTPLFPIVLARTFVIDVTVEGQLDDLATLLADQIGAWAAANQVTFGTGASPTDGQLVFDITLFAQLSGLNTQLLRLRNLFLQLTDVAAS